MYRALLVVCLMVQACSPAPSIKPTDFPSLPIQDFQFPESQTTIYGWLDRQDQQAITRHAWGIWTGLTWPTTETYAGQTLAVYETWLGVGELAEASALGIRSMGCHSYHPSYLGRTHLKTPKQFVHGGIQATPPTANYLVMETVAYSPDAACFATANLLFNQSTLDSYLVQGDIGKVPEFPVRSITTKPTYFVVHQQTGIVRLPVWTVTPDPAKAWKYDAWTTYVYVDLDNKQPSRKLVPVTGDAPTPEQVEAATCNATDFLHFRLDKKAAQHLNDSQDQGHTKNFEAGDFALLVAMHVTSKEIKNWTWQTFFWAADPDSPGLPSSANEAALRPDALKGAARHYAVSSAYAMVWPNQPVTGGTDKGATPIIAFNPYLEAGFGPGVFQRPNTFKPDFQYGVQTNCMSCHALATSSGKLGYTTDQYVDMGDASFINDVQLDFAWSIQGNLQTTK